MGEFATLGRALAVGRDAVRDVLAASVKVAVSRAASTKVHDVALAKRIAAVMPSMAEQKSALAARARLQRDMLKLPSFPTTFLREETARAIRWHEPHRPRRAGAWRVRA